MTPKEQMPVGIAHVDSDTITMTQWLRATAQFRIIGPKTWGRLLEIADELDEQAALITQLTAERDEWRARAECR